MASSARFLEGQHAVVTGGSRGIGAAVAADLARAGATLTLVSRSGDALRRQADNLREENDAKVGFAECDVTDQSAIKAAIGKAKAEQGPVTILVNNAGAAEGAPFAKMTREIWDRMISVNLTSGFLFCAEVIPEMLEARRGRIVNVSSTAGLRGYKTMTAYCAAKHGVIGLTRALALETAKHGITVNAVCPGYTDTDLTDGSVEKLADVFGKTLQEAREMLIRTIPRGSLITPEEVASAVTWLCSPAAQGVTGIALPIAGGEV
jgi:NAD(P)-dependent dehydrogenase (short-subunit alcohol dehydrogenase family)